MDGAKRSRTAQGVLAERAVLAEMGVLDDSYAHGMLDRSMAVAAWFVRHGPKRVRTGSVTLAGLAARVLWFDAQVARALDAGITQIAIIGAGYDSRAWRFQRDGAGFFELDRGAIQQDKALRAPGPGPTYVAADLAAESAANALCAHGFDALLPALFVVEGLTMYLGQELVRSQLCGLARFSAKGSRLAVDFYPPREAGDSHHHQQNRLQRLARAGSGEHFKLLVDRPHAVSLLESSGWEVTDEISLKEAARALVPHGSGLPLDAVNEHKSLLAASRS